MQFVVCVGYGFLLREAYFGYVQDIGDTINYGQNIWQRLMWNSAKSSGKVQFLFFSSFLLVLIKFSILGEDLALGYISMKFWDLSLKSFGNSWNDSHILRFLSNNYTLLYLWWKENLANYQKSQNIMTMIVVPIMVII